MNLATRLVVLAALVHGGCGCVRVPSAQACVSVTAPLTSAPEWNPPSSTASVCVDVEARR